jgi:alkylmercury lyase
MSQEVSPPQRYRDSIFRESQMAETRRPLAPVHLARRLQMSQEHLARVPDTEFDAQGQIVGWGLTLLPTPHRFVLPERPLLQVEAHVQSVCETSGQPITFVATPRGITDLSPATSVLSLILPTEQCDCVRDTFCQQSLFFQSKEAAASWIAQHPEAVLLSVEEAATLGQMVARMWPQEGAA